MENINNSGAEENHCQPELVDGPAKHLRKSPDMQQQGTRTGIEMGPTTPTEENNRAWPVDEDSPSVARNALPSDRATRAMLDHEFERERRREARWRDDPSDTDSSVSLELGSDLKYADDRKSSDSSDERPRKRQRSETPAKEEQSQEELAKHRLLAARWAVEPEHFDFEIGKPKLWIPDEDGGEEDVLSPWGLKYFDRHPEELKAWGRVYQDAYHDREGYQRVTHFRNKPASGPPPKLSRARQELLRQRERQAKLAAKQKKAKELATPATYALTIGTLMQPISGWMPLREVEDEFPFVDHTVHPLPTWSAPSEPGHVIPIAYCFIPKRYRPKPWGDGEKMPEGGYNVEPDAQEYHQEAERGKDDLETGVAVQTPVPTARRRFIAHVVEAEHFLAS